MEAELKRSKNSKKKSLSENAKLFNQMNIKKEQEKIMKSIVQYFNNRA